VRVLIVDDSKAIQSLVRRILENAKGYTVLTASGGTAALRTAGSAMTEDSQAIQLVLTDLDMPCGSGWELGQQLAARWPTLPVVYMSGTTHGLRLRARLSHDDHFLMKPFRAETLLLKIGQALGLAAQTDPQSAEVGVAHEPVN
jgi:CheY-like chemotaxis protein